LAKVVSQVRDPKIVESIKYCYEHENNSQWYVLLIRHGVLIVQFAFWGDEDYC
jgi:hypothetical protein